MDEAFTILVINCGSSSIKYRAFELPSEQPLFEGAVSGIGDHHCEHTFINYPNNIRQQDTKSYVTHRVAFDAVIDDISSALSALDISLSAIGHRVVHGGEAFYSPTTITPIVIDQLEQMQHLAPQHLPSNILGMQICVELFDDIEQVAIFDTAFHHNMPEYAYRYPIPKSWFKQFGIRRYGFHGSSHNYVAKQAAIALDKPLSEVSLISLHLGNGASACAIQNGQSIDTSMGFTPLEGLMMGSRSGDIDAAIPLYLQQHFDLSADEVEHALNFDSGLQAICNTHDMHDIIEQAGMGDDDANLALEMYIYHIRKYIGAYIVALDDIDAIVFTGGVGEHAPLIRACCCANLERFGIELDQDRNNAHRTLISTFNSEVKIFVIATNEELEIAQTVRQHLST
jgi:acetate kinase